MLQFLIKQTSEGIWHIPKWHDIFVSITITENVLYDVIIVAVKPHPSWYFYSDASAWSRDMRSYLVYNKQECIFISSSEKH